MNESTKPRTHLRNRYVFAGDLVLTVVAVFVSFGLRLELDARFWDYLPQMVYMSLLALVIKPMVYRRFGLYSRLWAYASISELKSIFGGVLASSILLGIALGFSLLIQPLLGLGFGFPRSIPFIDFIVSLMFIGGFRLTLRILAESAARRDRPNSHIRKVLIVGAGDAGALVVREIQKNPQTVMQPVAFVDDDPAKQGQRIHNIPVAGAIADLGRLIDRLRAEEVIIALPSAPGQVVRKVADICRLKSIPFRTMPGIYELLGGKVSVSRLREVEISDLLRRAPARIDYQRVGENLSGKRVLVTGAGGSIGRELCRQIARWSPSSLVLLGHGENSIFEFFGEIQQAFPGLPLYPVIADVRDADRLTDVFETHRPQIVFHAAAHKHVPLMESNVAEAVDNNVRGTRNLAEVCINENVERLIMISTDKAVRPSSVMGATKRIAELVVLDAAHRSGRPFSVVRFGNVLGSRGSVVPHFKQQILRGGPVTVTHPEMQRYFMTIPEAVHLVLQAMSMGNGGEVFVLRMGEQVRILDLAEDLIRLSGLEPGRDIEITFSGVRPGEKLSEELWDAGANYQPTSHPDVVRLADETILGGEALRQIVDDLLHLARECDPQSIVRVMDEVIPGAQVRSTPPPDINAII